MKERTATLPCALCARSLDQRADKNSKPYFVCEPCGTQFFIRGASGRERLATILRSAEHPTTQHVKPHLSTTLDREALQHDLAQLQAYIESFCEGQLVIPSEPFGLENAVAFPKWSGEVCDRISSAIDLLARV